MPIFQLSPYSYEFPSPHLAEEDGLLALGGDLHPERLIAAYRLGIFPWYNEGDPLLWWTTSPRLILIPEEFHLSKRLARTLRQNTFTLRTDTAFAQVIACCADAPGRQDQGTWISKDMQEAYIRLHHLGFAHSVEAWQGETLAGGLYGVCLDGVFFGESMFTRISNGSKAALAGLVGYARHAGIKVIDCQMTTTHLQQFGAREVSRQIFQGILDTYIEVGGPQKPWQMDTTMLTSIL